jgi:hypothetical protein
MGLRLPFAVAAVAVVFTGGVLSSRFFLLDAHAQAAPLAATMYVPSDGLAFRTFDGRVVARLSYDAHGGVLELYDEHEQPAMRWRGDPTAHAAPAPTPVTPARPKSVPDYDPGF